MKILQFYLSPFCQWPARKKSGEKYKTKVTLFSSKYLSDIFWWNMIWDIYVHLDEILFRDENSRHWNGVSKCWNKAHSHWTSWDATQEQEPAQADPPVRSGPKILKGVWVSTQAKIYVLPSWPVSQTVISAAHVTKQRNPFSVLVILSKIKHGTYFQASMHHIGPLLLESSNEKIFRIVN